MAKRKKKKLKKSRYEGKGAERFFRLLILIGVGFLVVAVAKNFARQSGASLSLPKFNLPKLSDQDGSPKEILNQVLSEVDLGEKVQDEPIAEPVEGIQDQTQSLIESLKQLPQDQLEAVKEQVYQEICQDYCRQIAAEEKDDVTELPPEN